MSRSVDTTPQFFQKIGVDQLVINAWRADNVLLDGEDGLAYLVGKNVHINPSQLLLRPLDVAARLVALDRGWTEGDIHEALGSARAALRSYFKTIEVGADAYVVLHGTRLRIPAATWQDAAHDIAKTRGVKLEAVRAWILDQARATLANMIATFEWP